MQNRIDRAFIISGIVFVTIAIIPFLVLAITLLFLGNNYEISNYFTKFIFLLFLITYKILIPIGIFIQITTFMFKIFSQNKSKKDWLIIFINALLITIFSGLTFLAYLTTSNPLI